MGKFSRDKGMRQEYLLRDYLRKLGWTADRVPSSGAAEGFKGDIKAEKNGRTVLFELKARKDKFKKIYELYAAHRALAKDDVLSFVCPGEARLCLDLSDGLDAVFDGAACYEVPERNPLYKKYSRTFRMIANLQKLLGKSEILVIKDDRQPLLFLRFR